MKRSTTVQDVMSPDVMTVSEDMTTDELAHYLNDREISGAPVVDDRGQLVGVVSLTDIARHLAEPSEFAETTLEDLGQSYVEERAATVRDVMTPAVHQVPATAAVAEAARMMIEHHIHRLVVTNNREPVGIVTSIDLLRVVAGQ